MSDLSLKFKVAAFLLLLPLILTLYPALQWQRVQIIEHDYQNMLEIRQALREDPAAKFRLPSFYAMKTYTRETLPWQLDADILGIDQQSGSLALRKLFAGVALLSALAALGIGLHLLLTIRRDRRRAGQSFDYLLGHFSSSWQQVSRQLQWHILAMLVALLAMLGYESAWSHANWYSHGFVAIVMTVPLWGSVAGGIYLLLRLRRELAPLEPAVLPLVGRQLTREAAPGLWQWTEQIARKAGVPSADHIVVGLESCFFVSSCPVWLEPEKTGLTGRTLYLPLTYLSLLSQAESAAIVAHELGHFAHGDTDSAMQLAPLYRAMEQRIELMLEQDAQSPSLFNRPAIWTSVYFLGQFDQAYQRWSRAQELAADRVSVRVESALTVASALLRVTVLADCFSDYFIDRGPAANLPQALDEFVQQRGLHLVPEVLESRIAHPCDSHPPTRVRLESLAVALDEQLLQQALRPTTDEDRRWFGAVLAGAVPTPA